MYYIKSYTISDFQDSSFPISLKVSKILGIQNATIYSYLLGVFVANHQNGTIDSDGFFVVDKRQISKLFHLPPQEIDNAISKFKNLELCLEKKEELFKIKLINPIYEISGLRTDYFNTAFFSKVDPTIIDWVTKHKDYLLSRQTNISLLIKLLDEYSKVLSNVEYEKLLEKILTYENIGKALSLISLRAAFENFINDNESCLCIYPYHLEFGKPRTTNLSQ